jgi:hypothetical protein
MVGYDVPFCPRRLPGGFVGTRVLLPAAKAFAYGKGWGKKIRGVADPGRHPPIGKF